LRLLVSICYIWLDETNCEYSYKKGERRRMHVKKIIYIVIGCIGAGLGTIGTVLPMLPTFPFLLLAAYCFAKSSKKLNDWFVNTKLYKDNLESYVEGKGMTKKTKLRIMATVTLLMSIGFIMMHRVPVGQIALFGVWVFHMVYFIFGVKTLEEVKVQTEEK